MIGWEEAGRGLGRGWVEAAARLEEGLEEAGWRLRGGFQEASRRLERRLGGEEASRRVRAGEEASIGSYSGLAHKLTSNSTMFDIIL